jgi:hypothetical protein
MASPRLWINVRMYLGFCDRVKSGGKAHDLARIPGYGSLERKKRWPRMSNGNGGQVLNHATTKKRLADQVCGYGFFFFPHSNIIHLHISYLTLCSRHPSSHLTLDTFFMASLPTSRPRPAYFLSACILLLGTSYLGLDLGRPLSVTLQTG